MDYKLKRSSRNKRLKITINEHAEVIVKSPLWMPKFVIEGFVRSKKEWIAKTVLKISKKPKYPEMTGEIKAEALCLVEDLLEEVNKIYGFEYKNVRVKNQKSRWGSCSSVGNLNFNYKLLFLPRELARYVVVHELCHLKEMNHSSRFWKLVEKACPDQKELRRKLKRH